MIHQRQRLPFRLKPRNHALGVHPRLDDFQGDSAMHRLQLFRSENHARATFADLLQQPVTAYPIPGLFDAAQFLPEA